MCPCEKNVYDISTGMSPVGSWQGVVVCCLGLFVTLCYECVYDFVTVFITTILC